MVLLRFAPSPTGALHLGGLRTALLNHLYARKLGGKWILRIEDTDTARTVPGSVEGIRSALAWAKLDYDYGPEKPGPHGSYFQSERLDLYNSYANKLLHSGHAYRCFCTPDRLAATREKLARSGSNATYDKACLSLTDEEVARRVRAGEKSVVRLNDGTAPERPSPPDIVFGALRDAHASLPTDPVLIKSDLFPTYHLASVVDDHEMGITHVLRGEEWLPSVPLHLDLYASLKLEPPKFAHLPLLMNLDGTKMSKRKGDVQVVDYIRRGWEPEALLNWLALSGWGVDRDPTDTGPTRPSSSTSPLSSPAPPSPGRPAPDSTAVKTLPELIDQFELSAVTHRRSILDPSKLEYLNKHHLMRTWAVPDGLDALAARAHRLVKDAFPTSQYTTVEYIKQVILALQGRLMNMHDLPTLAPFFFNEPDWASSEATDMRAKLDNVHYEHSIVTLLEHVSPVDVPWDANGLPDVLHSAADASGVPAKTFMTSARHALSGMKTGPALPEIMAVLGRERTVVRLKAGSA